MKTVLVTGGSGFVGSHCLAAALKGGFIVKTTIRSKEKIAIVKEMLSHAGIDDLTNVSFHIADLKYDDGWEEAMKDVDYVLHVASPFSSKSPTDEEKVTKPSIEGTLRVLKLASDFDVKRVVLTSSFGAIGYGHPRSKKFFTENDWSPSDSKDISSYIKSKIEAEKMAWQFIKESESNLQLTVINPVGIFGPILGKNLSSSIQLIQGMLQGKIPATPKVNFGVVDVRDLAQLHIKAMLAPNAQGQRIIASATDCLPMIVTAKTLRQCLGAQADKVPKKQLPDWFVKLLSLVNQQMKELVPELGREKHLDRKKAVELLDWHPRPIEETLYDTAKSLFNFGLV
ncbi:SDR family oxidoreductase [Alteromonas lipotrueae]|uniref:SDR family oxidoreductase n=1 Tax=Alteromonas lipotrueae TaxID=2803814 RepID=UPI001C4450BA|nr:aldehyde reductase [Alteromonas lipotrueae]